MGDLHNVIELARDGGKRTVILGGHSLGGAEASIYPVWDFNGRGGYQDIAGIVGIDGDAGLSSGFGGTPYHGRRGQCGADEAAGGKPMARSPWLRSALDHRALRRAWGPGSAQGTHRCLDRPEVCPPALGLKPPVPATNQALLGYAFDASTSPAALALIHVHSGHLAANGSPRGWVNDGPTPIQDIAFAFSQEPLGPVDWYYPERLTIDAGAASSLTQTPAADVLGLRLYHLSEVDAPLYVIQTSLGGTDDTVADAARAYHHESKIPSVTIVNRYSTYSHLDPLLAAPSKNAFLQTVVPWIEHLPAYRH